MSILERLAAARTFQMLPSHPSNMGFARRWTPPPERAVGHEDGYIAENDFVVTTKHFKMRRNCHEAETGTGRIIFLYHLGGKRTIRLSSGEEFKLNTPSLVTYRQPEGISKTSYWEAGEGELAVGLGFDPIAPPQLVQTTSLGISFLHDMLTDETDGFKWIELPLEPMIDSVARSMVFCDVNAQFLQPYLAAKASELLCLTLDYLINRPVNPMRQVARSKRLAQIKVTLDKDLKAEISMEKLAEKFDIPKRELNRAFEDAYGVTIREYSTMVRMGRSVYLLTETNKPLKQIAYEVGYGHASNFCFAFKRCFGETPKSVRERAVQRTIH